MTVIGSIAVVVGNDDDFTVTGLITGKIYRTVSNSADRRAFRGNIINPVVRPTNFQDGMQATATE